MQANNHALLNVSSRYSNSKLPKIDDFKQLKRNNNISYDNDKAQLKSLKKLNQSVAVVEPELNQSD